MNTQQMLQEIQDKIGDKTLCAGYIYENLGYRQEILLEHETEDGLEYDVRDTQTNEIVRINRNTILLTTNHNIGHPISLSRVLSALGYGYIYHPAVNFDGYIAEFGHGEEGPSIKYEICKRKLLNEENSDCMLSAQSPETIKAIWEIVCK